MPDCVSSSRVIAKPDSRSSSAYSAAIASDRLRLAGGDFFNDPLPVADAYILMEVIHDWDDTASRKILSAVRRAARLHAKLLLVEVLP
jgi:hypothetical protein